MALMPKIVDSSLARGSTRLRCNEEMAMSTEQPNNASGIDQTQDCWFRRETVTCSGSYGTMEHKRHRLPTSLMLSRDRYGCMPLGCTAANLVAADLRCPSVCWYPRASVMWSMCHRPADMTTAVGASLCAVQACRTWVRFSAYGAHLKVSRTLSSRSCSKSWCPKTTCWLSAMATA